MKDKKGFTLIELLAVIVILAIIMVIAIPQILNVINSSRDSAWRDNVKMIAKSIKLNTTLYTPESSGPTYTVSGLCTNTADISKVVDYQDTSITCSNNIFSLVGTGQFSGKTAAIDCSGNSCNTNISSSSAPVSIDIINSDKVVTVTSNTSNRWSGITAQNGNYYYAMWVWQTGPAAFYYNDKIIVKNGESYKISGKASVWYNCSKHEELILGFSKTTNVDTDFDKSQTLLSTFSAGELNIAYSTITNNSQNFEVTIDTPGEYYVKGLLRQTTSSCSAYASITEMKLEN